MNHQLFFNPNSLLFLSAKGDLAKREMDASVKVDMKTLLQLTSKHKMVGERSITTVFLDAPNKPKYIEATLSCDPSVSVSELDHIFEFKSKEFFVRFLKGKFVGRVTMNSLAFEISLY